MAKAGDTIRILKMEDDNGRDWQAAKLNGEEGMVEYVDSIGQLHGTWGGLAVNPECDEFEVIHNK